MVQLILLRPGSTDYDQQARLQGTLDIPLSDVGRTEAAAAAERLRPFLPVAVYCSPGSSAEDTAALVAEKLNLKPKLLDRLCNFNLGLWQGMSIEDVRRKQPKVYKQWQEHPDTVCPPEGEMLSTAIERAEDVLQKLARKHRTGAVVLVTPEPMASIIRQRLEGTELGDLWRAANGCGRIDVLHLEPSLVVTAAAQPAKNTSNGTATPPKTGTDNSNGRSTPMQYQRVIDNRP